MRKVRMVSMTSPAEKRIEPEESGTRWWGQGGERDFIERMFYYRTIDMEMNTDKGHEMGGRKIVLDFIEHSC